MSATDTERVKLTEDALVNALLTEPQASVLVCGKHVAGVARRLVDSADLGETLRVHVDLKRDPDAWELF